MTTALTPSRFMRIGEVTQLVALSRSTIYERMAAGTFPRSRSLGGGVVRWVEADVRQWMEACVEAGNPATGRG